MNAVAQSFDLSAIMRRAWEIVKAGPGWRKHLAVRLKYALQDAWAEAKRALASPKCGPERIRDEITALEAKDRWS